MGVTDLRCNRFPVRLAVPLAVVGLLLLAPSASFAADDPNILSPRLDLTIWTIVVFGLLFLVLRYVKLPGASAPAFVMMLNGLKKREETIQGALNEAQQAREEAQRIRQQLQQELDQAGEKVREILDEARRDAQRTTEDMIAKARAEIDNERQRLHREIDVARDRALQELWSHTANLAALVAAKAIGRQLTLDDHQKLLDEALAEFNQSRRDQYA